MLAADSLKYHWYRLLWLHFCLELSFHYDARARACAHTHSLSSRSFSDIHIHIHTHTHTHTPVCMRSHAASPPHLFLSFSPPEVLQFLLFLPCFSRLGQACSHIVALLFHLEYHSSRNAVQLPTEKSKCLSQWNGTSLPGRRLSQNVLEKYHPLKNDVQ